MRGARVPSHIRTEMASHLGSPAAATALIGEVRLAGLLSSYLELGLLTKLARARAIAARIAERGAEVSE